MVIVFLRISTGLLARDWFHFKSARFSNNAVSPIRVLCPASDQDAEQYWRKRHEGQDDEFAVRHHECLGTYTSSISVSGISVIRGRKAITFLGVTTTRSGSQMSNRLPDRITT